jgi:ribonucleoside-diphosphate reductase alpha chain
LSTISQIVWETKYRHAPTGQAGEACVDDSWRRVASAVAAAEANPAEWQPRFHEALSKLNFLPGGRILAGAGTQCQVTLYNCFVAGTLHDSVDGILGALRETAITLQQGGGVGCDFSPLRPAGAPATRAGTVASGPVSFLRLMATLRCDHPDIEAFVAAKLQPGVLGHFNLSVLVTDAFMHAVETGSGWRLRFPAENSTTDCGEGVLREIDARKLWQQIAAAAHGSGEPGLLFIDRINRENNLRYCETISATNPCGEVPLPPHGACNLGSINLPSLVLDPFSGQAGLDTDKLQAIAALAVRFLDDVTDVSRFPLPQQKVQAQATRRIGLGIMGLADMVAMLGLHYGSDAARRQAEQALRLVRDTAYRTSAELAAEKGAFPRFAAAPFLASPFVQRLPEDIRAAIRRHGLRNSHLLAIAPTGSISLLAGNVSSGIEPIFALSANRTIRGGDLQLHEYVVRDHAFERWREAAGGAAGIPEYFVTAEQLPPKAHLDMQACLQPLVDGAISKTINLPSDTSVQAVQELFSGAYAKGLKGCTVFRAGSLTGRVLQARNETQCCPVEGVPS